MSFSLTGHSPRTEAGEYFWANIFAWHPLASWIEEQGPQDIVARCKSWHTNDCIYGLADADARALATWIRARIADGSAEAHFGVGRLFKPELHSSVAAVVGALGSIPGLTWSTADGVIEVDDLEELALFLENCGGFSIG